jgi:tetratricopeptide (TPR) repeat protein
MRSIYVTRRIRWFTQGSSALSLFLLFAVSLLAQSPRDDRFDSIYSALQGGNFNEALGLIRPALTRFPNDPQLWAMQGVAYAGEKNQTAALASFHHAIALSPDYLPALQGAAQIEYEGGKPDAIPLIKHVLRLRPGDPTSYGMLALLEYQQRNCAAAVEDFGKAGTLFDAQPAALHANAICLVRLKQFDRAASIFERTLALHPDDPRERRLLAAIQVMSGKPADALSTLGPLLQTKDPDADTLELASRAHEGMKDTSEAVSLLRRAILLEPQNLNLYLDFANLSYAHDSFQVGVDVITDGLALQPNAAPLYFSRGVLYVELAQYDKAEADFEKAYELDPNQSLSSAAQGLAAAQENNYDRALAKVQAALARKPDNAFMLYLQADILAARTSNPADDDFKLAIRSARGAVRLQPTLGPAWTVLAKLDLEAGRYKQAAEECRRALHDNPSDQAAVYHLIQALRKTGDMDEVPELLKRLALLRHQSAKDESDRYRYQLVESDTAH